VSETCTHVCNDAVITSHSFSSSYFSFSYAFGIIICSLSLVTIVLMATGLICGIVGYRKDCNPEERSGLSHCGGIFLVM